MGFKARHCILVFESSFRHCGVEGGLKRVKGLWRDGLGAMVIERLPQGTNGMMANKRNRKREEPRSRLAAKDAHSGQF